MRRLTILGATGSIGRNTVALAGEEVRAGRARVVAVTGGDNVAGLAEAARALDAEIAVTGHEGRLGELRAALAGTGIEAAAGPAALIEAAARPADWVMSAIVGAAGLPPGLAALEQGATLALANKETLVAAGPLVLATARRTGARLLPVDSEHSAILQALTGEARETVEKVTLTASGGAFRDWPLEALPGATPEQAAMHPNWSMGTRITIDSASMFNKALEMIEARELFALAPGEIDVLIHPQSRVHALVAFRDGAVMAHLGEPDMRHAIAHALGWPERRPLAMGRLDLAALGRLDFAAPDPARYPALELARAVMATGGHAGAVFNAAKERALDAFLAREIAFTEMARVVATVLDRFSCDSSLGAATMTLESVLTADRAGRAWAAEAITAG